MDSDVKKAGAMQEISMEALESAAIDVRAASRADLERKLDKFIAGHGRSVSETKFYEENTTRTIGIYADDADWDDPELEPIGYEEIPMLNMRAERLFVEMNHEYPNERPTR